jgi:hypothetical protein
MIHNHFRLKKEVCCRCMIVAGHLEQLLGSDFFQNKRQPLQSTIGSVNIGVSFHSGSHE